MHTQQTNSTQHATGKDSRTALSETVRVIYASLPSEGDSMLPLKYVIGQAGVSEAQAARNRAAGKGPARPRPQIVGIVPMSSPTLYRALAAGRFVKPLNINLRTVAFAASALRAWLAAQQAAASTSVSHKRRAEKA